MSDQDDVKNVIDSYRQRQQNTPKVFIISAVAMVLIFVGGILLYRWYTQPDAPLFAFLSTDTPTPTSTTTPSPIPPSSTPVPPTNTSIPTDTPTITLTPTIEGPFFYTVQENDTLSSISEQFGVDVLRLIEVNELENDTIFVGQAILIPDPNAPTPSRTPLPENMAPGTPIEYRVQPNDTLITIAEQFNSTEEAILEANEDIEDANSIFVGQIITVPVNLVTPAPSPTPGAGASTPGSIVTLTPTSSPTP